MSLSSPVVASPVASSADLIARYDANAPRYTSYPTAAQFTPAVGAGQWSDWLARAPLDQAVSLYLHIPFCKAAVLVLRVQHPGDEPRKASSPAMSTCYCAKPIWCWPG